MGVNRKLVEFSAREFNKLAARLDRLVGNDSRRRRTFEMRPKAFGALDVFDIIPCLDGLKGAYRRSLERGDKLLESIQQQILSLADPRYGVPVSLPLAVRFLDRELSLRREVSDWQATIRVNAEGDFPGNVVIEPRLLCAAAVFAIEYTLQTNRHANLEICFGRFPVPTVRIQTNAEAGDLWFHLEPGSRAETARGWLLECLKESVARGTLFEVVAGSPGHMAFHLSTPVATDAAADWLDVERTLGMGTELLSSCDLSNGVNRVYVQSDTVHKVQRFDGRNPKLLVLAEEYNILHRLKGVPGIPEVTDFREYPRFAVLSYRKIDGIPLDQHLARLNFERTAWFRSIVGLSALLNRIHRNGVLHRDLRPENIIVNPDGDIHLIDFDQAVTDGQGAEAVDLRGKRAGIVTPCISVIDLISQLGLREQYLNVVKDLKHAWGLAAKSNASSPGRNIAYYRWTFGSEELPGERDWFQRWDVISSALRSRLRGSRVLDLGCNLGLVATHCMLYGARHVTAIDLHEDVLEAGRRLAGAAGVDVDFLAGDLDTSDFVNSLRHRPSYDLVIALSVLHWLDKPDRVLPLLLDASAVLYEGHRNASVEAEWLRGLGFQVQLLGYSERLRALYLATKQKTADRDGHMRTHPN